MTRIWERLFLGSLTDAERLARKNPNRIATVISLCEQGVNKMSGSVLYIHLPIEDDEPVPVRQFNAAMDAIAGNIPRGRVLVHCAVGLSRSPTVASTVEGRMT